MLDKKIYLRGIGALAGIFHNYRVNADLSYNYLQDLTDEEFMKSH